VPALVPPDPSLSDGYIHLRPFELTDAPAVTRACQDPEISRWTATIPYPYTQDDAAYWIATHDRLWSEGQAAPFAIITVDDELIGSVGLESFDWPANRVVAGYWVAAWARGRGVATAALDLATGWAFDEVGIAHVELTTKIGNVASERVAEKAGFQMVEILDDYEYPRAGGARFEVKYWRRTDYVP
jgi:RimJ/RimL family protein N-acetyltransferase